MRLNMNHREQRLLQSELRDVLHKFGLGARATGIIIELDGNSHFVAYDFDGEVAKRVYARKNAKSEERVLMIVGARTYDEMSRLCNEPDGSVERDRAIYDTTVRFNDNIRMVIQVVSTTQPAEESCWTQGVLFDADGNEIGMTDVGESFGGEYCITHDGVNYVVEVTRNNDMENVWASSR